MVVRKLHNVNCYPNYGDTTNNNNLQHPNPENKGDENNSGGITRKLKSISEKILNLQIG